MAPLARLLSQHLVPTASVRNPQWQDAALTGLSDKLQSIPGSVIAPGLHRAILIVRVFSTRAEYSPSWEKEPEGRLNTKMSVEYSAPDAWTLVPLFTSSGHCDSGTHRLPLFPGGPRPGLLNKLAVEGVSLEVGSHSGSAYPASSSDHQEHFSIHLKAGKCHLNHHYS